MKTPARHSDFQISLLHPHYWPTWLALPVLWLLAWMPWRARHWLGKQLGRFLYKHNAKRRHIIQANLSYCFPKLSDPEREVLAKHSVYMFACALLDYSLLFFRSRHFLWQRVTLVGREKLDLALEQQQNIILLLGHSVWLEFAPLGIGQYYRAYGSYKPFKNAVLNWLIARSRLQDVEFVVSREEGMIKLVRSLEPGRLLFLLPDEDHGTKHSVFAPFFGVPKATLTSPARIAKRTQAVCFPVFPHINSATGEYSVEIGNPIHGLGHDSPEAAALQVNQGLEKLIAQYPAQYMWQLKLFRTQADGSKRY